MHYSTLLFLLPAFAYISLMLCYLYGWRRLKTWTIPNDYQPQTRISILIAARNEAANIGLCLNAILANKYPANLLEIIVIDDHSEDDTASQVKQYQQVHLLSLANYLQPGEALVSPKKKALEYAISQCSGELILTTDADCIVPENWLDLIVSRYQTPLANGKRPVFITAPVLFYDGKNLLQHFQALDFAGMMGITGAGIELGFQRMANGANLAYPKVVFESVGGFSGSETKASGDDMFLLQKIARQYPDQITFIKNQAAVRTAAKANWPEFIRQRLRWGTKNAALPEWPLRIALALVFVFCWSILINTLLLPFYPQYIWLLLFQIGLKAAIDYLFLREMCRYFNQKRLLRWFWPSQFLHTGYIALIGIASLIFQKYQWKGRALK